MKKLAVRLAVGATLFALDARGLPSRRRVGCDLGGDPLPDGEVIECADDGTPTNALYARALEAGDLVRVEANS